MPLDYKIKPIEVDDAHKYIEKNKESIFKTVRPYLIDPNNKEEQLEKLLKEVIEAANWTVCATLDAGPDKRDKKYDNLQKQLLKARDCLNEIPSKDLMVLNHELRRNNKFINYSENSTDHPYHKIFNCDSQVENKNYDDGCVELQHLRKITLYYLEEFNHLLTLSIKQTEVGKKPRKTKEELVRYIARLGNIFKRYTGHEISLGGKFERFCNACIESLSKGYTDNSVKNAIRKLNSSEEGIKV